jgi:2-keto-3-deoxy-L-fuconate dehydrogenase
MSEFDNLVAIVTGGASGLGAATAALLVARGARVAVLDRTVDGLSDDYLGVECDVTDTDAVNTAVQTVVDHFGALDIVINNAGIGAAGDIAANDDDEWHRVLDVNVVGIARVTRASLPHLRKSHHAAIVNTCSIAGVAGLPNRALYSASKGAVAAVTLAMAADHVREGIRVNAVTPGTADTPWVGRLLDASDDREAAAAALRARQPMGRLVTAPEVAHAIVYLASPLSSSTTGTLLAVDGGMGGVRVPPVDAK